MFCDDSNNPFYQDLQNYIAVVHRLAEQFDAVLVPLQKSINEIIKNVPPEKWSDDMVHPYVWAHCWIAQRWFEATILQDDPMELKNYKKFKSGVHCMMTIFCTKFSSYNLILNRAFLIIFSRYEMKMLEH